MATIAPPRVIAANQTVILLCLRATDALVAYCRKTEYVMTISFKTIRKALLYACFAYVLFIVLSFAFSMPLPHFRDVGAQRNDFCYWTNVMIAFVECGSNVRVTQGLSFFYNFWMTFIYYPMFAVAALLEGREGIAIKLIGFTFLLYTPIALMLYSIFKHFKTRHRL